MLKKEGVIHKSCVCEQCGDEANMTITCELPPEAPTGKETEKKLKAKVHCAHCGNEADIWLDF
jgi:hypothetical protein